MSTSINNIVNKKNIIFFERYSMRDVVGFGIPFKEMMMASFHDLGYNVLHINNYSELAKQRNSIIFSVIKPENYITNCKYINQSNYHIWWNLEPFFIKDELSYKLMKRRDIVDKLVADGTKYNVDKILFFDSNQADIYGLDFMPIGYHNNMDCEKLNYEDKTKKHRAIFIGTSHRGHRIAFFKVLRGKVKIYNSRVKIMTYHHSSFKSFDSHKEYLGVYRIGIDTPSGVTVGHVHWHRLMMYAANRLTILTKSDLSKYGFKNRIHYIRYNSIKDCLDSIEELIRDEDLCEEISKNMLEKVKADFFMPDLIRKVLPSTVEKYLIDGYGDGYGDG